MQLEKSMRLFSFEDNENEEAGRRAAQEQVQGSQTNTAAFVFKECLGPPVQGL